MCDVSRAIHIPRAVIKMRFHQSSLSPLRRASFYVREDLSSGDLFPKLERLSAHQRNPSKESQRNWGQIGGGRNQSSFPVFSFLGNIVAGT